MRLKDRVAIVTGAANGIGRATAYKLSREGAIVVIADLDESGAKEVADDIVKSGGKALAIKTDVTDGDAVDQMVERAIKEFGKVDIFVNDAAYLGGSRKPFHEIDRSEWKPEIEVTFVGVLNGCRAIIPHMIAQKSGRIINLASDSGKAARATKALYSACKAAVAGFSRAIALELATKGVTVNCVSPGPIKTPRLVGLMEKHPELEKEYGVMVPMQRMGKPEEIADMIVFLASDEASFITGQDYSVDGGQRM